jgi:LysR family transcriptional regulator, regulator for bpeEF and oprC
LHEAEFSSRVVDISAEGFDVALRGDTGKHKDTSLTARKLVQRAELSLYASPSYLARRGNPRGVASPEHDWLVARPLRRALELPATITPKVVANDFLFLRGVAVSGGGIASLPAFIAQPFVASGDLVRVLPSVSVNVGGLVLMYSSTRPLARKIAAFRDFLVEVIQREWVG